MRLLSSLLCVCLLFVCCCVPASAMSLGLVDDYYDDIYSVTDDTYNVGTLDISPEDFEQGKIILRYKGYMRNSLSSLDTGWHGVTYDNANSLTSVMNFDASPVLGNSDSFDSYEAQFLIDIVSSDPNIIIYEKGSIMDFGASNLGFTIQVYDGTNHVASTNWWHESIYYGSVFFTDKLGMEHRVVLRRDNGDYTTSQNGQNVTVRLNTTVPCDAYRVRVQFYVKPPFALAENIYGHEELTYNASLGFVGSMFDLGMSDADSSGFFASLFEWLGTIRDRIQSVAQSVANLGSTMTNVWNSIKNLPSQIWQYISDGLTSLFIPDEESITGIKEDWDSLMSDRFGAIYDAGSLITDWAGNFQEQTAKDTIKMPSVTVNLAGTPFTFGGYDVKLIPDGFGALVEILKGLLDIVCTLAFVNAMRKRYDSIVGGG